MNRQRPCYPSSRRPTPIATYVAGCDAATGPPVEFTLFGVTPLRPSARAACETCGQESCVWWWDLCLLYKWSQSPPNHEACTLWPRRTYLSKNGRLANVELPSRKLKNAICYYRALPGTLEAGVDRGAGPSGSDASFRQHPHRCPPNKSAMRQPSFHAVGENRDSEGRSSQSHRACVWVRGRREREGGGGGVLSN